MVNWLSKKGIISIFICLLVSAIVCTAGATASAQAGQASASTTDDKMPAGKKNTAGETKTKTPAQSKPEFTVNTFPGENETPDIYIIGPEDVLEISVWQNADLSRTVNVRPDGKISLPLINDVQAAGLTTDGLKRAIITKLIPFISSPDVAVIVQQINSWRYFIQGEVVNPGVYPLRSRLTISQAIILAGGCTEFARKRKIKVIREIGNNAGKENIKVNYNKIISGKDVSQDIYLKPGDTIIVP